MMLTAEIQILNKGTGMIVAVVIAFYAIAKLISPKVSFSGLQRDSNPWALR